jgi:hypothetical protein
MNKNLLKFAIRLSALACLSSVLGLAESWSGTLVDSKCWNNEENDTRGTSVYVDRDRNLEVRLCSPKANTKSFALVLPDGFNLKLDASGNAKAAEIVQSASRKSTVFVAVTGEASKNEIKVDSISAGLYR